MTQNKTIKLFDPVVGNNEIKAVLSVLKSHLWASGAGSKNVLKFEKKFNDYLNSKVCISVNSGTAALHLALSLFDIKNKEVILPSLSFVSTAHAVLYNGGKPVFADIDPVTLCLDPGDISSKITKKTSLILPVHFAGMACNLNSIKKICVEHNLKLVEDAAHAAGTSYRKKKIGSHGDAVCFSFHPVKNLAMPTGGAVSLNGHSKKFEKLLLKRRWCGISNKKSLIYDVDDLGWNFYMNEFSASIGLEQLKKLDKMILRRQKIAKKFSNGISVETKMPFNDECSYHFFWLQIKNRKKFIQNMNDKGIETGIHYSPIHLMSLYNSKSKLPITEDVSKKLVSIPNHPNLSDKDVDKIIECVNKFS